MAVYFKQQQSSSEEAFTLPGKIFADAGTN
jgi:hypothetical protein